MGIVEKFIKESKRLEDVVRPFRCLVLDSVYGKE